MNNDHLPEGTLLDERYQIREVLGEGGFGITYAAWNQRIRRKVAVKELFWREHVYREPDSPVLFVPREEERTDYEALKEKFMREARLLRDFDREPGVVQVLDYFEANNTAYLVMEYLEGVTFRRYMKLHGVFGAEDLFRRLLPLLESLCRIHQAGVIHRDISPDNIMILEDGSLKLLDFGAARNYKSTADGRYTAIVRENYAPGEQFDRNGRQGPWTDVYALSATIYEGVTGSPPESAVQRMFLDELKKPSQMGISIEASYERIIMKGLEMQPENRYPHMEAMKKAVEGVLPLLVEPNKKRRSIIAGIAAGAGIAGLVIGIFCYREYDRTHKFRNIETEIFRLTAHEEMTAEEFAQAQLLVEERLEEFAGADNYIMEVQGDAVTVTLPLEVFDGQEIGSVLEERFVSVYEELPFSYDCEIQARWEDPEGSLTAGENQCLPEAVDGVTVTQVYACRSDSAMEQLTRGEWSNLLTDMKIRLDALDTPYAVGFLYGDDSQIVVKMPAGKTGDFIASTLGQNGILNIRGQWSCDYVSVFRNTYREDGTQVLTVEKNASGDPLLACHVTDPAEAEKLQDISGYCLKSQEPELYLDIIFGESIAGAVLTEPVTGNTLEFTQFYIQSREDSTALLEYICTMVNDTHMPETLLPSKNMFQDETGAILFDAAGEDYYGIIVRKAPKDQEFLRLTEQMEKDGWEISRSEGRTAWVQLGLKAGPKLIKEGFAAAERFIRTYGLQNPAGSFYLCFTDEQGQERCRIIVADSGTERAMIARLVMVGETMTPYFEEAKEAWEDFDPGESIIKEEPDLREDSA